MPGRSVQQMAGRVAELLESRLKIRGKTLADKVRRGRRMLPRRIREAARHLAEAERMSHSPRLALQIDHQKVAESYDACLRYLGPLGEGRRIAAVLLNLASTLALAILIGGALFIGALAYSGRI